MIALKMPITYPALQPGTFVLGYYSHIIYSPKQENSLSFTEDHDGRTIDN